MGEVLRREASIFMVREIDGTVRQRRKDVKSHLGKIDISDEIYPHFQQMCC